MMPEPQIPVIPVAAVAAAKPASSDHRSQPMTLKRGSSVPGSMRTPLDGSRRGTLAAADLGALESRTGRTGAGEQAFAVAQHDLGIGADVDQQRDRIGQVGPLGQHHARRIGADVPGDARQHVDAGIAVNRQVQLDGPQRDGLVGRQRERRAAELDRG